MLIKNKKLVYSIAGVSALFAISIALLLTSSPSAEAKYTGVTREYYLFTEVEVQVEEEEEELHIPPDLYSQSVIIARKGDTVRIHFYNLEPEETQEHHSFTIFDGPYKMDHDLNAGENTVIEFKATERGMWDYFCKYHEPTMRGVLVIWP
jgi:plastocyanin